MHLLAGAYSGTSSRNIEVVAGSKGDVIRMLHEVRMKLRENNSIETIEKLIMSMHVWVHRVRQINYEVGHGCSRANNVRHETS